MIAVDAMGGDFAPQAIVLGSYLAAKEGIAIRLYGNEEVLNYHLTQINKSWKQLPISIIHCSETITMEDEPANACRKKDSSLVQAVKAVEQGYATAIVSAGNTGACLVSGILILGKLNGILRPAIGDFLPTKQGLVFCIDLGANVDCKPEHLVQFAIMGECYVRVTNNIERPRIALLSNGAERSKGNKVTIETYHLLEQLDLNFIGNAEPDALLDGKADVIVCDGFAGNILLKAFEAMTGAIPHWLKTECMRSWLNKGLGYFIARLFKQVKTKLYAHKGGALLLGLNNPFIVAHGSSKAETIKDAILYAHSMVQRNIIKKFNHLVSPELIKYQNHAQYSKVYPHTNVM